MRRRRLWSGWEAREGTDLAEVVVDGHTFDLLRLAGAMSAEEMKDQETAFIRPERARDARVGMVGWVWTSQRFTRAVVTGFVMPRGLTLAFVTQYGALAMRRRGRPHLVHEVTVPVARVRLEAPRGADAELAERALKAAILADQQEARRVIGA